MTYSFRWAIDLIDWLAGWLVDWLIGLIDWFDWFGCFALVWVYFELIWADRLMGCLIYCFDGLSGWLIEVCVLIDCMSDLSAASTWLKDLLVGWLVDLLWVELICFRFELIDWLIGLSVWLVDCLYGWMVVWLIVWA